MSVNVSYGLYLLITKFQIKIKQCITHNVALYFVPLYMLSYNIITNKLLISIKIYLYDYCLT
jgi:hypothetical protein